MHLEWKTVQLLAIAVLFALVYAGRMIKGSAKEAADGLEFPLKPVILWTRLLALPMYFAIFGYPLWQQHRLPMWLPIILAALAMYVLYQLPGTIVLTPMTVEQRFWLRGAKKIGYNEVMAIQVIGGGRMTRVMGDNGVSITHSWNHSAAEQFREEIARRTGKRAIV